MMIASIIKPLVLLCLISLLSQPIIADPDKETWDGLLPGNRYRHSYEAINEYLVENVASSETMPANLAALMEAINSGRFADREVRVAQKLIGLKRFVDKCDQISYECLNDNDEATGYKSHDITSKNVVPRRIDKLINYYGRQHGSSCQRDIESLVKPKMQLLDKQILHRLSIWLDPIIDEILTIYQTPESQPNDFSNKAFYAIIKQNRINQAFFDYIHAYDVMKTLVKDNPIEEKYLHYYLDERAGERLFHRKEIGDVLFKKYFENSCGSYLDQMGELFRRADIDARFYHNVNPGEPLFYRGWAYVKICSSLFSEPANGAGLLRNMKYYAEQIADKEEQEDIDVSQIF